MPPAAIKSSEMEDLHENGVNEIIEVKIGYDGIVIANAKLAPMMKLTARICSWPWPRMCRIPRVVRQPDRQSLQDLE